jgi:hypothetical protein
VKHPASLHQPIGAAKYSTYRRRLRPRLVMR